MVSFQTAVNGLAGYLGIRWTNTDEPSVHMRADRALKNPIVWNAVSKISGHIGQLPLNLHRMNGRNIEKPTDHYVYNLMRVRPNAYQIPFVFKRTLTSHALLWGNGYAYIHKVGLRVAELIPLRPDAMAVGLYEGEKVFVYCPNRDERIGLWEQITENPNETLTFTNDEILHIQGLGSDGVCGYSLISLARESWEGGLAAMSRNLSQLRKGHSGGVVLEAPPGQLRDETKAREFLEAWRRDNDGESNAGKTALLREGVNAKVLAMSNRDAEFIETLKHMRQEEALRFMLESVLGDDSSVSYNSLEQKNLAYLQNCLAPWMCNWEEESERKLLTPADMVAGYYMKFNDGALLRIDKATSMQTAATAIQNMVWTRNEVREMFDYNPVEGGDEFLNPAITPGAGSPEPDPMDDNESDATPSESTNRAASRVMLERLCKIEQQRAEQAASSASNFCAWIDKFYAKWEPKLANDIEEIGGDRELATIHCNESKRGLLECAEQATQDTLADVVGACVENWQGRASGILTEMELVNV